MLNITERTARIGNQIQSRGENHGEDTVTAIDIPLTDVMLDEREFNALMGLPNAFNAFFDRSGGLLQPAFTRLKPLALSEKIEGARVVIKHGVAAEELRLGNAKIAKIKLEPVTGGFVSMSCTVQCVPTLDVNIAHLLDRLNSTVELSIDGGQFGAQQELALGASEIEEPEIDADDGLDENFEVPEELVEKAQTQAAARDETFEAPAKAKRSRKGNGSTVGTH